jgi:hypothetical protein
MSLLNVLTQQQWEYLAEAALFIAIAAILIDLGAGAGYLDKERKP